ncbi:DUF417 family protein [Caballeronia novacaledonica]|uniref:Uncharacterized protein n=1 Tax=Caballeronia novacaledonica TaxID=1544861 RepID=A0AA37IIT2_9BURK|nr:DUF417 family protein [Caballeronia novacaledonica]GJH30037.1 hypothetical protein CBA19CS42_35995 [Caballeronia novacaledonica]
MNTRASQFRLQIAEKSAGSLSVFAMLRWALVVVFLWFGAMKFTAYEANGIAPFIINSPIMSWLHRFVSFWRLSKPRSPTLRDLELNRRPDIRAAHPEGDGIHPKVQQTAKRLQIT